MNSRTDSHKFKTISRRELSKLTPILTLGRLPVQSCGRLSSLKAGLGFGDLASVIGLRQSCSARAIWLPRFLTLT